MNTFLGEDKEIAHCSGTRSKTHVIVDSVRRRCVISFTPRPLYALGKVPCTHWVGGCVRPTTGLNDVERRKLLPPPGLELRPLSRPTRQSLFSEAHDPLRTVVVNIIHNQGPQLC